jgi:hypothetical protein
MKEEARADSLIFSARNCSSRITTFDVPILGSVESVMCASSLVLFWEHSWLHFCELAQPLEKFQVSSSSSW